MSMQRKLLFTIELIKYEFITFNHGEPRQISAFTRSSPRRHNNLPMSSFASPDIVSKYSSGKQKSHLRMLAVVSSTESSKNGDSPLRRSEMDKTRINGVNDFNEKK